MSSIKRLILASHSPFRRTLLAATGLVFEATTAPVNEAEIHAPTPRLVAERRAVAKALAVAAAHPESLVIGADQVLSEGGTPFDKVQTAAEATARLTRLAGKTHMLHSGIALAYGDGQGGRLLVAEVIDVPMRMRALSAAEVAAYVATDEWQGSVGCYQFENRGAHLFDGPGADQSTIIGLPIYRLLTLLRELGVNGLTQPSPPWALASRG